MEAQYKIIDIIQKTQAGIDPDCTKRIQFVHIGGGVYEAFIKESKQKNRYQNMDNLNAMLDLETMGIKDNSAIVAIGAVCFDLPTGGILDSFYRQVSLEDAVKYGEMDASTVLWWLGQSDEARKQLTQGDRVPLKDALRDFSDWFNSLGNTENATVWGNGVNFDNAILKKAYEAVGLGVPWKFWNDRDVRTIVDLGVKLTGTNLKETIPFVGERHNALADATHQAKYVSAIYRSLQHLNGESI
jgi:hypothetical protein